MRKKTLILLVTLVLLGLTHVSAQMALVQRMDLSMGSDRKLFAGWLLKQGFAFDSGAQETTRQMAQGISSVLDKTLYGETYLNNAGNIRIRIFTDTLFRIMQVQVHLAHPVSNEGDNFITALKSTGYKEESRYANRRDRTRNCLLSKDGKLFTVVESDESGYLLIKASLK
jgi:hypothetical protein